MKNLILIISLIISLFSSTVKAQKKISDSALEAQQRRNVYIKWGDFKPEPSYPWWSFGLQMNPYYTTVWSWIDLDGDRGKYRKGPDIRPLGPVGEQTQREASLYGMLMMSNEYKKESDEIGSTAVKELLHNTGGILSEADPMWILYYRKTLKDVNEYNLSNFTNKLTSLQRQYLVETKIIEWLDTEMIQLHERLDGAKSVNMDRGSRILNYHRIMLEYEKILGRWNYQVAWADKFTKVQARNSTIDKKNIGNVNWSDYGKTDLQIMEEIIRREKRLK